MKGRPNGIEGPWLGLRAAFPQGRLAAGVARTGGVGAGRPGHHPHGRCGRTEAGRGQPVRAGVPPHPFASLSLFPLYNWPKCAHFFSSRPHRLLFSHRLTESLGPRRPALEGHFRAAHGVC